MQPLYIHSAKSPNSGANACFEAAMLYAVLMAVCYIYWRKEKLRAGELDFLSDSFTLKRDKMFYGSEDSDEELPLAKNMSPTPRMV
ncbi:hypothetical protein PHYBOEH_003227 [Phytophthora boehmeriae]|uniref:Uncharacterized protein n=1 Tax=Phytophthora boehmeriae TaxID=109152 RepID=A0A8T1X4B8_9STRA|nr:hypothetical protein PHYBOEH_003227 [Phytophthora boehmeriae]